MKKLPLALSALAISTVSVAGAARPTWATTETLAPANQGLLDTSSLVALTKINPRENSLSFVLNRYDDNMSSYFFDIEGLGAAEDRTVEREASADQRFLTEGRIGWSDDKMVKVGLSNLSDFAGLTQGVEYKIVKHSSWTVLTENTSGVMYYVIWGDYATQAKGKIDYSPCINSGLYKEAEAAAGDDDVLECRMETDGIEVAEGSFHYWPYLNGERLEEPEPEPEPEPTPDPDPEPEPTPVTPGEGGGGGTSAGDGRQAPSSQSSVAVENTETGVSDAVATGVEQGSASGSVAGGTNYTTYATYTTATNNEGSAYQNSENTGVTDEYAADADVWAVDESKVWDEGATEVETPELGEDGDCGHFWLLVVSCVLAVAGWGAATVLFMKRRK